MVVAVAVLVSAGAGWAIASVAQPRPRSTTYEATAIMVQTGDPFAVGGVTSLETVATLSTMAEVAERVATALDHEGDPQALIGQTRVEVSGGIIRFTARTRDADEAVRLANTFARQTRSFVQDLLRQTMQQQLARLSAQLDDLQAQIDSLDIQLAIAPPREAATLQAQLNATVSRYELVYEEYQSLAGDAGELEVIVATAAVSRPSLQSSAGLQPPSSTAARVIVAAILGLLAGIVIALVVDRLDQRIRTREGAEKAFDLPVLAEIPFVPRWKRKANDILAVSEPRSRTADAFRVVSAMLSLTRSGNGNGAGGNGFDGTWPPAMQGSVSGLREPPRTILVTSPGPEDGTTTIVANLAATFGARGSHTLVLSCDLRRPRIHQLLGATNAHGLAEAMGRRAADDGPSNLPFAMTCVENVDLVPSGQPPADPGELLGSKRMRAALQAARHRSDVVLIDTAPILTTSDAVPLVTQVDAVLIVARYGRTTIETARSTTELLRRLGAPVVGVILNAAAEIALPSRFSDGRYYRQFTPSKSHRGIPGLARLSRKG
jgi:capsular exopolysaccharide synthesis family protein